MVKFSGPTKRLPILVNRQTTVFMVVMDLPPEIRESTAAKDLIDVIGVLPMSFYTPPVVGDLLFHAGYTWEVTARCIKPNVYHAKGTRRIPHIYTKFVGAGDPEGMEAEQLTIN